MILNAPRPCSNNCGATIEWAFDRHRRVGLIESATREPHLCAKRLTGAHITCACGARIHVYADGSIDDARTRLPHVCTKPAQTVRAPAAPPREDRLGAVSTPPALEPSPPRRSLNDALGVG